MMKMTLMNRLDKFLEFMETDLTRKKKDVKVTLNNMPFLNNYKKSKEGRIENPPDRKTIAFGSGRSPRPDPNGYRNPPNRRQPDPED